MSGARKLGLSDAEIQKVKEEWEEKQRKKEKAEKEKEKEDAKEKEKDKTKEAEDKSNDSKKAPSPTTSAPTPSPAPKSTHQRYTLHRDIFAMRLTIHRKRRQTEQAKRVAPTLPSAPHNPLPKDANPS